MRETYLIEAAWSAQELGQGAGKDSQPPLLLVMVLGTAGSTYQKAGACALFCGGEVVAGLVSGGCLEGELAELSVGFAVAGELGWVPVRYDTRASADDLLGTALGCRGCLDLALIPLNGRPGAERLLEVLAKAWSAGEPERGQAEVRWDRTLVLKRAAGSADNGSLARASVELPCLVDHDTHLASLPQALSWTPQPLSFLLPKRRRVLVLGCGSDALPMLALLFECGFEAIAVDHRPQQLAALERWLSTRYLCDSVSPDAARVPFSRAVQVVSAQEFLRCASAPGDRSGSEVHSVSRLPAAVLIMSHHLDWDARYLEAVRGVSPKSCYVGLLGPPARRREVFRRLGSGHPLDVDALHSPMGLDLKARGPSALAVAVVADLLRSVGEHAEPCSDVPARG